MFTRTTAGLINKFLFYSEPIIWVEGPDDLPFYYPIINGLGCRIEAAGGKDECERLSEFIIQDNLPYIVVIDSDYEILMGYKILHDRVIYLHKYSIENYFFEREIVQSVCCKYSGSLEGKEALGTLFDEVEKDTQQHLYELVVLDVANHREGTGLEVIPTSPEKLIDIRSVHCSSERVSQVCKAISINIKPETISESRTLIDNFLRDRRFSDLLKGHFIFGIIRHLIRHGTQMLNKRLPNFDNDSMYIMLSLELWNLKPSAHCQDLEHRIRNAVTQALELKSV